VGCTKGAPALFVVAGRVQVAMCGLRNHHGIVSVCIIVVK